MVVNDLDLPCFTIAPRETDTPSFVDANAVVPAAVALQRLKPITGRCSQIIQSAGGLERQEFRPRPRLYPQFSYHAWPCTRLLPRANFLRGFQFLYGLAKKNDFSVLPYRGLEVFHPPYPLPRSGRQGRPNYCCYRKLNPLLSSL